MAGSQHSPDTREEPKGLSRAIAPLRTHSTINSDVDPELKGQALELEHRQEEIRIDHWYDGFVRLFVWYPSYMPRSEKWFLFKLDVIILLYVCASYFTKSLDKSNITNAYVTNMKEEINFGGDDLAYAKSLYSAGYIVSMCFGIMFVTRPWARFMLPILETVWGVLTFCEAAVSNPSQMYALRFLVGLAEGPIFPSVVYTLGSWYKRDELFRRVMAFSVSSSIGGIFSGFLQTAAYDHLRGKGGMSGWKWGFIIDGIFTVPIALIGFAFYPGSLDQAGKVWWLKKDEYALAKNRMRKSGVRSSAKITVGLVKRVFLRWHVHYYTAFWVLLNMVALPDGTGFPLWLEDAGYSVSARNNYPSLQSTVSIVAQFVLAGLSDTVSPIWFLSLTQLLFIISYSSLAAWNIPVGYKWFCFMIIGFDSVNQAIVSGQINRSVRRDAEERAFVLGFSDAVSQAMNIWTNIAFYPTDDAPKFHLGYIISTVAAGIMLFLPILQYFGDKWDQKHYALLDAAALEDDSSIESTQASSTKLSSLEEKTPVVEQTHAQGDDQASIDRNGIAEMSDQTDSNGFSNHLGRLKRLF